MTLSRFKAHAAISAVRLGGVIAYPTEAVFGLGCDPHDKHALSRILRLKQRKPNMGFILIGDTFERVAPYFYADQQTEKKLRASWPGPTTWVLPAQNINSLVTGFRDTIAVRVTAHEISSNLCQTFGDALVSTSANRSGLPPARSPVQVRKHFGQQLDGIVHGALGVHTQPTKIIDAATDTVLRSA